MIVGIVIGGLVAVAIIVAIVLHMKSTPSAGETKYFPAEQGVQQNENAV